jgi:uncharacterized protein YkwD
VPTLSEGFKAKVADLYKQKRANLEKLDPAVMEAFAAKMLELVNKEKAKSDALHDLGIIAYNMTLLKNYSAALKMYKQDTDEYDFTQNDCKNLVDATKKWLTLENLI